MNQMHVVKSASKAVLRAMNALDDLHAHMLQLKGQAVPQHLLATSGKVRHARELVQEIDAALTDPSIMFSTKTVTPRSELVFASDNPLSGSK